MLFPDQITLNTGWRFALGDGDDIMRPDYDDSGFAQVSLPHDWQIANPRDKDMKMGWSQGYYPRDQIGWYRLRLDAPAAWEGKTLRLIFDGCQRFYAVYLNGALIGEKRYGYVPYLLDVTNLLRPGQENVLCVRVDNHDTLGDRWYSGAGLYRGVRLLVDAPAHFAPWGVRVGSEIYGARATVHVHAEIESRYPAAKEGLSLAARLTGPSRETTASYHSPVPLMPGEAALDFSFEVDHARRWDIDHPHLYKLELTLLADGKPLDKIVEPVGFRDFAFDGDRGFLLNGRVRKLYGANLHHDGGLPFGAAVPEGQLRRRLLKLKEMGCNAIRCSHNPHDESLYRLCDTLGLVVIDELYDKWTGTDLYYDRLHEADWRDDLRAMVRRSANHPSVVLWSMGNELEIQYSEPFYARLAEMRDACRALDPTRPVSLALIGFCIKDYDDKTPLTRKLDAVLRYAEIVDVFMGNYMEGFYQALRDAGMRKAIIGSEVFSYYRLAELSSNATRAVSPWKDVKRHPYVAGGFVWAGVDYLGESSAWPCQGWTGCPIDSAGFWKLRAWHLRSQWTDAPVLRLGVFDENDPWDMATANWSFPQMSRHWSFAQDGRMMHVAAMTNCDEVWLYLNDDAVRVATPDPQDRMAHFYIPFRRGTIRAVGYTAGEAVCEDALRTATGPHSIALSCDDLSRSPLAVAHVEATLLDEHGQPWTLDAPEVTFSVTGGAALVAVDNGDFVGAHDTHTDSCPFHLGHALAYLRADSAAADCRCTITARCMGLTAELVVTD